MCPRYLQQWLKACTDADMVFVSTPANAAVYSAAAAASAANLVAQLVGKSLQHNYLLHESYTTVLFESSHFC